MKRIVRLLLEQSLTRVSRPLTHDEGVDSDKV